MVHPIWDSYPHVQEELYQVREIMSSEMTVIHPDVRAKILEYINAPGKYIRAGLCLLFSSDDKGSSPKGKLYLAASIELIHLATLIHDDVIDEADHRRGVSVINKTYSNRIAIYAGDYLLAYANRLAIKAAELLKVKQDHVPVANPYLLERILAGELAQLMNHYRSDMSLKDYLKQIKGKTAFLFALSCQTGVWRPDITPSQSRLAFKLGQDLGMAFQLSDDLIDYHFSQKQSGKPRLQDIKNGIYTAPFLFAKRDSAEFRELVRQIDMKHLSESDTLMIYQAIERTGAFELTVNLIKAYMQKVSKTLDQLDCADKSTLKIFLNQLMERTF